MNLYSQPSSDDGDRSPPTSADVREFALRRQEEREGDVRRPSNHEDAWQWFLSFFPERRAETGKSDVPPLRRAA